MYCTRYMSQNYYQHDQSLKYKYAFKFYLKDASDRRGQHYAKWSFPEIRSGESSNNMICHQTTISIIYVFTEVDSSSNCFDYLHNFIVFWFTKNIWGLSNLIVIKSMSTIACPLGFYFCDLHFLSSTKLFYHISIFLFQFIKKDN